MIASKLPKYPWQKIGSDLFERNRATYMLVVNYFSRYIVAKLNVTSSIGILTSSNPCSRS